MRWIILENVDGNLIAVVNLHKNGEKQENMKFTGIPTLRKKTNLLDMSLEYELVHNHKILRGYLFWGKNKHKPLQIMHNNSRDSSHLSTAHTSNKSQKFHNKNYNWWYTIYKIVTFTHFRILSKTVSFSFSFYGNIKSI